jgi:ribose 1,5-bisphosphokinase
MEAPVRGGQGYALVRAIAADPQLHWARRLISRPEAAGGEPFEAVSPAAFADRLARGDFALHWDAHGLRDGVPHPVGTPPVRASFVT